MLPSQAEIKIWQFYELSIVIHLMVSNITIVQFYNSSNYKFLLFVD